MSMENVEKSQFRYTITLLEVLREDLGLIGTKHGCELGECRACTVLIDGQPSLSCLVLPVEVQESEITTIEGVETNGHLHPLRETFAELGAAQCGYCTPGILLSGIALLRHHPQPTRAQMQEALAAVPGIPGSTRQWKLPPSA